jgi:hypothetical protein
MRQAISPNEKLSVQITIGASYCISTATADVLRCGVLCRYMTRVFPKKASYTTLTMSTEWKKIGKFFELRWIPDFPH